MDDIDRKLKFISEMKQSTALLSAINTLCEHILAADPDDLTRWYTTELVAAAKKTFNRFN